MKQPYTSREREIIAAAIQCVAAYMAAAALFALAGLALSFSLPESLFLALVGIICVRIIEQTVFLAVERMGGSICIELRLSPALAGGVAA